jgi:hypothetical protein
MREAARLRAQKAYSTDPDYLERMARASEAGEAHAARHGMQTSFAASAPLSALLDLAAIAIRRLLHAART